MLPQNRETYPHTRVHLRMNMYVAIYRRKQLGWTSDLMRTMMATGPLVAMP